MPGISTTSPAPAPPRPIVVALGGNALQKDNEATARAQEEVARATARQLAPLIAAGQPLVIVHGNGPQVGNIVLHEEALNTPDVPTLPLDTCVAMSQGSIGYWLQNALQDELALLGCGVPVVTLVSQMLVDRNDPAFTGPSKPIGPFYSSEAEAHAAAQGRANFVIREDAGRGWRRVVPSPKPLQLVEEAALRTLLGSGTVVITAGGGGVPIVRTADGTEGVEAVIDKDFSAAVVAKTVDAARLVILTAVDNIMINFGKPDQQPLETVTADELRRYADEDQFAAGSMLPKVQAALLFADAPGKEAVIGPLERAVEVIRGEAGTVITL